MVRETFHPMDGLTQLISSIGTPPAPPLTAGGVRRTDTTTRPEARVVVSVYFDPGAHPGPVNVLA